MVVRCPSIRFSLRLRQHEGSVPPLRRQTQHRYQQAARDGVGRRSSSADGRAGVRDRAAGTHTDGWPGRSAGPRRGPTRRNDLGRRASRRCSPGRCWGSWPPATPNRVGYRCCRRNRNRWRARLSAAEQATAARLQQLPQFAGRTFSESPHVGAEFVDDLGRSYDALGTPAASARWNQGQFLRSIDSHLLKSNDFTVVDLTGFTSDQAGVVSGYLDSLSPASQARIVRIGF